MANEEHIKILNQGVATWNKWRKHNKKLPDLSNAKLSNTVIRDANFTGTDLTGANFTNSDLMGTSFHNSLLIGAKLEGANLTAADLKDADLTNATLKGADLRNADLTDAYLIGADLRNADLTNVDLTRADLTVVDLTGTILTNAKFAATKINRETFGWEKLSGEQKNEITFVGKDGIALYMRDSDWQDGPSIETPFDERTSTFDGGGTSHNSVIEDGEEPTHVNIEAETGTFKITGNTATITVTSPIPHPSRIVTCTTPLNDKSLLTTVFLPMPQKFHNNPPPLAELLKASDLSYKNCLAEEHSEDEFLTFIENSLRQMAEEFLPEEIIEQTVAKALAELDNSGVIIVMSPPVQKLLQAIVGYDLSVALLDPKLGSRSLIAGLIVGGIYLFWLDPHAAQIKAESAAYGTVMGTEKAERDIKNGILEEKETAINKVSIPLPHNTPVIIDEHIQRGLEKLDTTDENTLPPQ